MTDKEAAALIIQRWRMEHDAASIMVQLIVLGKPLKKADVLAVIRAWVASENENRTYLAKA